MGKRISHRLGLGLAIVLLFAILAVGPTLVESLLAPEDLPAWRLPFSVAAILLLVGTAFLLYRSVVAPVRQVVGQAVGGEITRSLSSTQELDHLGWSICQYLDRIFDASAFYLALYDESSREWETALEMVLGQAQPRVRCSVDDGLTGYIIRNRQSLLFGTAEAYQRFHTEQGLQASPAETRSWMGVPMITDDLIVGVLAVATYDRGRSFGPKDLDLLSALAEYAAAAIENARFFEKARHRSEELAAILGVGTMLLSTLDHEEVLRTVCREAVQLLDATSAYVNDWVEEERACMVIAESYGLDATTKERVSDVGVVYDGQEYLAEWLRPGQPHVMLISDPDLPEEDRTIYQEYDVKSILLLPLMARGRAFGYLQVWESRFERPFTEDEILLGQNLASQAAVAIENARLLGAIRGAVNELSSATIEILTATSQQASGASEQFAAVSQASSTIDEIRAIAEQTAQRAQAVADLALDTARVSQSGEQTVNETIAGMAEVRRKVQSIAHDILDLSERAQSIGEIIAAVGEIADQSNMLALNAAVEASRAGEAGKGFSVVAQEVRALAEQSRAATQQVEEILTQIQGGVNAAVMTTEEGMKGTDAGMKLAEGAGGAIRELSKGVIESTQAAVQIASAADQQQAGMLQISQAMESIHQITAQNVAVAQQVDRAAEELSALAGRLGELLEEYRLQG
jgi:methyl-accepting chemotaxis protein